MLRYQEKNASAQATDLAPRIAKYHQEALQNSLTEKESQISNYQAGYTLYQNNQFNEALPFWENYLESAEPSKKPKIFDIVSQQFIKVSRIGCRQNNVMENTLPLV